MRGWIASLALLWLGAAQGARETPPIDVILDKIDNDRLRQEKTCSARMKSPRGCVERAREQAADRKVRVLQERVDMRLALLVGSLKPDERVELRRLREDWDVFIARACPLRTALHARLLSGNPAQHRGLLTLAACRLEHRRSQLKEIEMLGRPITAPAPAASAASAAR